MSWTRTDGNNMLSIKDADGWTYTYIHINNDTPGTDDGANPPQYIFVPGIDEGVKVTAGQLIAYMGDSGNAEGTAPHLHFEIAQAGRHVRQPVLEPAACRRASGRSTAAAFDTSPTRKPDGGGRPRLLDAGGGRRRAGLRLDADTSAR